MLKKPCQIYQTQLLKDWLPVIFNNPEYPKRSSHYLFCTLMRRILTALALLFVLASCGKMKQPEFVGIENVKMKNMASLSNSEVTVYVKFFNPNKFNASVKHAEGDAWIDSTYIGKFVVDERIKIPAKEQFVVPVRLLVDMKKLLLQSSLIKNIDKEKTEISLKATGTLRAGRSGFYKNVPIKYEGKQDLQKLLMDAIKKPSIN